MCWAALSPPSAVLAQAATESATAIFREVERRQRDAGTEEAKIRMEITAATGRTRIRRLLVRTKSTGDRSTRSMIVFQEPADIRGLSLLTLELPSGDDQFLYLPSLRRVQRIAGSSRSDRFAGSDFTYEDLASYEADDFQLELVANGRETWTLRATPLDAKSHYGRIEFEVEKARFVVLRARYFNRKGNQIKELTASGFVEVKPGSWRADRLEMQDLAESRRTVLAYESRAVNVALPDQLFTERELQRGR